MDENQKKEESKTTFKTVQNPATYKNVYEANSTPKAKLGFGKGVFIPFISGILGCSVVIGTCFGIPSIREKLISSENTNVSNSSNLSSQGYVSQTSLSNYSDTSVYAANKILPSIVGIKVEYSVNTPLSIFNSRQTQTSTATASGSGIIISEDGYILTNNHIVSTSSSESYYEVSEATKVTVTLFNDTTEYEAQIIGTDEQTDLAVIKIDKTGLTKAEFADSDNIKVGEFAMAVGNPLGMQSSVTSGIVSAVNREVTTEDGTTYTAIQTDAAINSGNSGGALVNANGEVIGINTLKLSGDGIEGMGFAIPINSTTKVISELIEYKEVRRPYIGITGSAVSEEISTRYNVPQGVYVESVEAGGPAEAAGLKVGDIITKIQGTDVSTVQELNNIKNTYSIGDEVTLTVYSNNEYKDVKITLQEQVVEEATNNNATVQQNSNTSRGNSSQVPSSPDDSIFKYFFN